MKNEKEEKKLYVLSIPEGTSEQFRELMNIIRPFSKKHNIIITQSHVVPVNIEQLKHFMESMYKETIKLHNDLKKDSEKEVKEQSKPKELTKEQKIMAEKTKKHFEEAKK